MGKMAINGMVYKTTKVVFKAMPCSGEWYFAVYTSGGAVATDSKAVKLAYGMGHKLDVAVLTGSYYQVLNPYDTAHINNKSPKLKDGDKILILTPTFENSNDEAN